MNSTAEVRDNGVVIHPLNFSCPEEGELGHEPIKGIPISS